jgi:hypothetical protein
MMLALVCGGACTTMVPAELELVRCEQEGVYGPPACDPGEQCVEGECEIVDAAPVSCCSSPECPADQVCAALPSSDGLSLHCVDAVLLGHAPPGEGMAGETCFEAADCRSGSCQAQQCVDVCCGSSDCPGACVEGVCRS